MREIRSYGSVRGVPGNRHSYRDRRPVSIQLRGGNRSSLTHHCERDEAISALKSRNCVPRFPAES